MCVARLMLSGFSSFLYIFSATFGVTVLLVALTASRASAPKLAIGTVVTVVELVSCVIFV